MPVLSSVTVILRDAGSNAVIVPRTCWSGFAPGGAGFCARDADTNRKAPRNFAISCVMRYFYAPSVLGSNATGRKANISLTALLPPYRFPGRQEEEPQFSFGKSNTRRWAQNSYSESGAPEFMRHLRACLRACRCRHRDYDQLVPGTGCRRQPRVPLRGASD
jgi:hypothetical protein